MKAKVEITKSFDAITAFGKEWENGDFSKFFAEEGQYLDKLVNVMREHAEKGETFTVNYTVTVTA